MEKFLQGGKIVTTHGIRGELKIQPWADEPQVFCDLTYIYLNKGEKSLRVTNAREHKGMVIAKVEGIDTVEAAKALVGRVVYIDREDLELEEGAYFVSDLIGMKTVDADTAKEYGKIVDVTQTGANDVFHVRTAEGKMLLVPHLKDVVINIDLVNETVTIRPLAGLFDYED